MFSIVSALDRAGVLRRLAIKVLSVAKTPSRFLIALVIGMGLLAAFLVNDTIALLGMPLVVYVRGMLLASDQLFSCWRFPLASPLEAS